MIQKSYKDFLIRTKDEKLLRISYKKNVGIFYEFIFNNKIIKKDIVYKESLKYFYVIEDYNGLVNLIYQDIVGNIILCIFNGDNLIYRTLLYIKHNCITPINIKGFFFKKELKLLYKADSNSNKIYFTNNINTSSKIIYNEKNNIDINYRILSGEDYISLIIYSISFDMFKLVLKTYNIKSRIWDSNKIIFIANRSYIDMSFCITNNTVHSFIAINDEKKKSLIYKYNDLDKKEHIQRELIIYEDDDISSCLIIELNKVIWLLWISKKKMYGCYSLDFGESFSIPLIYQYNIEDNIRKIEFIDNGKNKETYISEKNGEITLFLEGLLNFNNSFNINYKEITYSVKENKDINSLNQEIKNIDTVVNNRKSQHLNSEYKLKK